MIAFLGTGLLGANFVRAFRQRNEDVQVWNRTPAKARELSSVGAQPFDDPADAVRGATRVHIAVSDDEAVDALLDRIRGALASGAIIVDHTTTAPDPTRVRAERWNTATVRFLHAPVFMGPSNALKGTGTMLASGDRALFQSVESELAKMTGRLAYLGEDPARAAAIKLMGNLFLIAVTGGIADMFALGKSLGVPSAEALPILEWLNAGDVASFRANRIMSGEFAQPSWTLTMARKDARLMIESAAAHGTQLEVTPAVAAKMDRWIAAGHGNDDWMVIGKDSTLG